MAEGNIFGDLQPRKLFYRTIGIDKGGLYRAGQALDVDSGRQARWDAKADAVSWVSNKLNDFSFDARVSSELQKLKPEITRKLVKGGGVLICVNYAQNVDFGYKSFNNMFVANWGMDFRSVLAIENSKDKIGAGTNSSFTMRTTYIWVTDKSEV